MRDEIILLRNFIKKPNLKLKKDNAIFVGKTKKSILIGPYVDSTFDYIFFYKRIISSCIYSRKIYKKISFKKAKTYIEQYNIKYKDTQNAILEIFNDGKIIKHNLLFM